MVPKALALYFGMIGVVQAGECNLNLTPGACSVCGDNKCVQNPEVTVSIPPYGPVTCGFIEVFGLSGGITLSDCSALTLLIETECGCGVPADPPPTSSPSPSLSPSDAPTTGPSSSQRPSFSPSPPPTFPTVQPSPSPSASPTGGPTVALPSALPSFRPSNPFPTVQPSPSPSSAPTGGPTVGMPSVFPSLRPSNPFPSPSPTPEPTCKDSSDWTFVDNSGAARGCAWVEWFPYSNAARTEGRCFRKDSSNGLRAYDGCPAACDRCPEVCEDSLIWTYVRNNGKEVKCDWVGQNPYNDARQSSGRCFRKDEEGTRAREACPVACGLCD